MAYQPECERVAPDPGRSPVAALSSLVRALGVVLALAPLALPAAQEATLWDALRSDGHAALLRHARAPGTGDPPEFTLGDCNTQRNLSAAGRAQAMRIGERMRVNGIGAARVFSSQWCRCVDTARLLGVGAVRELPVLNSFFRRYHRREQQTRALAEWLRNRALDQPTVLVTHQVNITALTGVYPAEGTLVVIRPSASGDIEVVGTIEAD